MLHTCVRSVLALLPLGAMCILVPPVWRGPLRRGPIALPSGGSSACLKAGDSGVYLFKPWAPASEGRASVVRYRQMAWRKCDEK
jgi:hypothetical protein